MEKDELFESFKKFALESEESKQLYGGRMETGTASTSEDTQSGGVKDDCDVEHDAPVPVGPPPA